MSGKILTDFQRFGVKTSIPQFVNVRRMTFIIYKGHSVLQGSVLLLELTLSTRKMNSCPEQNGEGLAVYARARESQACNILLLLRRNSAGMYEKTVSGI